MQLYKSLVRPHIDCISCVYMQLYKSLVRPHIDCISCVYMQLYKSLVRPHIDCISCVYMIIFFTGRGRGHRGDRPQRDRGDKREEPAPVLDESSVIIQQFMAVQKRLDAKHDKHERLVKMSRDVTIESKRTIFLLQRLTGYVFIFIIKCYAQTIKFWGSYSCRCNDAKLTCVHSSNMSMNRLWDVERISCKLYSF